MEKGYDYDPKYSRLVRGVEDQGTGLTRTLALTGLGYSLAHFTRFKLNATGKGVRALFLVPIFFAAYGWNLAFQDETLIAVNRNNNKEIVHQTKLGNNIE